jgi:ABC-type Mn2+/Zn2+ transport system ATPase subunit
MTSPTIILDRLTVGYGGHAVLSDLSATIPGGSFTALLGTNGSGKSTLLKTLLGLLPPLAGRIGFDPDGSGRPPCFGYVPQQETFDPLYPLSAYDVALMGTYGRIAPGRPVPAAEKAFAHDCLRSTGAGEFSHQGFSRLSGGQRQRVLIARALAMRPDLLILDEPTSGIDTAATQAVMNVIAGIHCEQALTILWVTHDLRLVRHYARQAIWLHEGRAICGGVAELLTPDRLAEIMNVEA